MARYTKKGNDGRYYIESVNGRLESDIFGHTYGEAIDRFAELENADVVPREEFEALQRRYDLAVAEREANAKALIEANIDLDAMRGAATSLKMHYENAKHETAREIFEEIRNSVTAKLREEMRMVSYDEFTDGFRNGKRDAFLDVLVAITELKKKYTED